MAFASSRVIFSSDPVNTTVLPATAESRFDSLALELRRPDGSIVRTKWIGVQDTAMMMAFVDEQRARGVFDQDEPEYDAELEASVAHDMEIIDEWFGDETQRRAELDEVDTPDSDDDGDQLPSFQLLVELGKVVSCRTVIDRPGQVSTEAVNRFTYSVSPA